MKHISRLLILCLLLTGCARTKEVTPVATPPAETTGVPGLYDTGSHLEISSSGAVKTFPLGNRTGKAILCFGDNILLFSEGEKTTLTLLTGETLAPTACKSLAFSLEPEDCAVSRDTISYFDPTKHQTMVLDDGLSLISQIDAPADMTGTPLLSPDGRHLYYCTPDTIRIWDTDSNIHRILRETTFSQKTISGLYDSGTVVAYQEEIGKIRFLSASTGALLYEDDAAMKLIAEGGGYASAVWETNLWSFVFSQDGIRKQALTPRELSAEYFLLDEHQVVTAAQAGEVVTLDRYDLSQGQRTATQMLRGRLPLSIVGTGSTLWGLCHLAEYDGLAIFLWDTQKTPVTDSRVYTGPHYTAQSPDLDGLAQCQQLAHQIGERYGLEILVWQDAAAIGSHRVSVTPEYRVNILNRELELLDQHLAKFPEGLLSATAENFAGFQIGLAAQVEDGSQQFITGNQARILLTAGSSSEAALYHQLFHVMDTHILSHSNAFDQWSCLNPQGFRYDYDYAANAIRDSGIYLTESGRSFIDTFSMSFPKEDRARVFEYAMLPGNEGYFQSKAMQNKLEAVCRGIREAYGLEDSTPYPWEQYLR